MKHRLICLFLALLMTPLVSCSETPANVSDTPVETAAPAAEEESVPEETEPVDPLAHLDVIDYEGYDFRMLIRNAEEWLADMYSEELTGEVVNDAVFKRNSETAERYNIVISCTPSSHYNYETDAMPIILAGEDAYDLVVPHPRVAHIYANEGLIMDWNTLKYVDLEQGYWDQDARRSFQMPGGLYCMIGDLSYQSVGMSNAMLFNKRIFDEYNLEYPYDTVREGKWTVDRFLSMAESYSRDLDGDGVFTENDQYGYSTFHWIGPIQAFYSSGARVIDKNSEEYAFNVYNERSVTMFEKYFGLLGKEYTYLDNKSDNSFSATSTKIFREGKSMFTDVNISLVLNLREMEDNFGILPWPKLEESDEEYWSNVDAGTNLFTIPITNSDLDRTSLILETMAILGREYIIPAYYDVALKTRDSRDEESSGMLDIIVKNRVFDLGYYNTDIGGAYASHFAELAMSATPPDFTSWYQTKEKAAGKVRDKTLKKYTDRLEG